ncbi:FtsW/RodA/SpoVE family cell cycle protein [Cytophaga aurantiaca]|uniref:FtsW/RodA/SpoVE family cell cycle protein n=1 Tax=Cytophaga aurantiaca TaxID=29530 RepID=UPI00035E3136|nr:FtsW/RodA/SpoVE family cell cycle protein [Cytophaga aurantiaca]
MLNRFTYWLKDNLKGDPFIWTIIIVLSLISVAVVYSASSALAFQKKGGDTVYYLIKHGGLIIGSLVLVWLAHKVDYKYYSRLSRFALIISVPILVFTFLMGGELNGASRWLVIPIINQSFQPSDLAKLALIANLASMLAKRQANIEDFKESFIPIVLWCGLICGLIALSNLSTALILFSTCLLLMFIGRVPIKYLFMLVLVGAIFGTIALKIGQRLETAINRIKDFFNDSGELPDQAEQAFIAIWNGGFFGKGPGNSDLKYFLPQSSSDFIYAIIIEEYGFIGGVFVLFLYLALLYRGMKTVVNSERAYGGLLSAGLAFSLVGQAMINMGVAVGLGPITGQPLPLVSMGGTSLLFTGLSLGIILSVSRGDISESNSSEPKYATA